MTRKTLCREIQLINQRLNLSQVKYQQTNEQLKEALREINPYLGIGFGMLAGIVTNVIGWRKAYTLVSASVSFYPLLVGYTNRLMSKKDD